MKIVVLDGYTENPGDLSWEALEQCGELTVYDRTPKELVLERIKDAQMVLINKTVLKQAHFEACPDLKYVGMLSTGYNIVDIAAAKAHGVVVSNIPSYGTMAVAQHTIALLLELTNRVGAHDRGVQSGKWSSCVDFCYWDYPLVELAGKTLGIIGLGSIGRAVAKAAIGLGMRVVAYSPKQSEEGAKLAEYLPLEELYAQSDVISLHCPLFPQTEKIINQQSIAQMKDGVLILNTSRGGLIEEQALREALLSGKVGGAGLDVASAEPIRENNPILGLENCIITPHIAWAARESRARLMDMAVKNVKAFLAGTPTNVVNP